MKTSTNQEAGNYTIKGRTLNSSGEGLPNLVVIFYDTDTHFDLRQSSDIINDLQEKGSERLGSAYTNAAGEFHFEYTYEDFAPHKEEKRPDIVVLVAEAEHHGHSALDERLLYVSSHNIKNASPNEVVVIEIKAKALKSASPKEYDVLPLVKYMEEVEDASKKAAKATVAKTKKSFAEKGKRAKENIFDQAVMSDLPNSFTNSELFVADPKGIAEVQKKAIEKSFPFYAEMPSESEYAVLNLTPDDATFLEIDLTDFENEEVIKIPYGKYCGLINKKRRERR